MKLLDFALERPLPIALVGSVAILGTAFFFEYVIKTPPCDLCWYQRYPYIGVIILAGAGLATGAGKASHGWAAALLILILALFVIDAGIAGFHVGVEQKWWEGPTACSGGAIGEGSVDDILAQIKAAKPVRCDEPAWTLFGISMAGYNFLLAGGMALFSFVALKRGSGNS